MKISNTTGLPDVFCQAVKTISGKYSKNGADFSVTELISPIMYRRLNQLHGNDGADDIVEDVQDLLYRMDGQADHAVVEAAEMDDAFNEERLMIEIGGHTVSGAPDIYKDGIIYDVKRCSVWAAMDGPKAEWVAQLNMYAHLFREAGFPVDGLEIIARYRDWSATKAMAGGNYPRYQAETIKVPVWSDEQVEMYIMERVAFHSKAATLEPTEIGPCCPEERWHKDDKFACKKEGRKSAVRVFDDRETAEKFLGSGKAEYVEERPGEDTRCLKYCAVNRWCPFFQENYPAKKIEEDEKAEYRLLHLI